MSRRALAALVATFVVLLTAACYWATTRQISALLTKDSKERVVRAARLVDQGAKLELLQLLRDAEELAAAPDVLKIAREQTTRGRAAAKQLAFDAFLKTYKGNRPDIVAMVDATGEIIALDGVSLPVASDWKVDGKKDGEVIFPAVAWALAQRVSVSEVWNYPGKGLMRVGVASVVDYEFALTSNPNTAPVVGAVVIAHALTSQDARTRAAGIGANVAYAENTSVFVSSFVRGNGEDVERQRELSAVVAATPSMKAAGVVTRTFVLGGEAYEGVSVPFPRFASEPFPSTYPAPSPRLIALTSPMERGDVLATAQRLVVLLGGAALIISLVGMYLTGKRVLAQIDQVELGISDIINGNIDRTFAPVGEELDGLSNGLNVMLARLLGRPEPGEETQDDLGQQMPASRMDFEAHVPDAPAMAPDLAALAQEPEPDYYKRIFEEYTSARAAMGQPDKVAFENFIAKLRVNEAKLKVQFQCKAVRFRVVVGDGKVTLKPVPIVDQAPAQRA